LDKIGIHLWAQAYSQKNTALVKQMLNMGSLDLYKAHPDEMGGFEYLYFSSVNQAIEFVPDEEHIDFGFLVLEHPLAPKDTITFSSTFRLKIPVTFSRMGRTGDSYQLTQWYPHIAVLDDQGWHLMPYLDYGEYFNDFADYEVTLTVPRSYTIAGTGVVTSKVEQDTNTVWTFSAHNVIDFAWFASPTYVHQKTLVDVGRDQPVELNIYTEPIDSSLWQRAIVFGERALKFYSNWLGPYPYQQVSVVSTPFGAPGGMEYPMVGQIGPVADSAELDLVIAHEIGHTWLYGILANNERAHSWLDEGLNTFIENQYARVFRPFDDENSIPPAFKTSGSMSEEDLLEHSSRFDNTLQPPQADPEYQRGNQYYLSAYFLGAQGLEMMKSMHGEEMMKMMFRKYYEEHHFTHVSPADMQSSFEKVCDCQLDWYFDQWIHHAHEVDYRIEKLNVSKKEITISNHGNAKIPVRISTYNNGRRLMDQWIDGFDKTKILHMDDRLDEVHIYDQFMGINKSLTSNVKPYKLLPRIGLLPKLESYDAPTLSITPVFGYNLTDGFMPGVAFTSGLIPQQKFKFFIAPLYGLESKKIRGHATLRYINDFEKGPFDKYLLSFGFDDFGYYLDTGYYFRDHYSKWEPTLAVRFKPNEKHTHFNQWLKYRYVHINQFYGQGLSIEDGTYEEKKRNYGVHELLWQLRSDYVLRPFEATANVQTGKGFTRVNLRYKQQFVGRTKHLGTWIQGYAGWLPQYGQHDASVHFTYTGQASNGYYSNDYMYDQWLGGRNAESGLFSQQIFQKDAHLKTLSTEGLGEDWMVGAGISHAFPFRFLHIYMDATVFPSAVSETTQFSYSGGVAIVLAKDVFEIYLPLLESKDIKESLSYEVRDVWFKRVSFTANVKLANPVNIADRTQLGY
jgi:peptidase M1-like protein